MLGLILALNGLMNADLAVLPKPVSAEDEAARVFGGLGSSTSAAGQARGVSRLAKAHQAQVAAYQGHDIDNEMQRRQELAYDAERWPHCMEVSSSRLGG